MAERDYFVFIWDEDNQQWTAELSTFDNRRKSNTLSINADILLEKYGARRASKGDRKILYVPKSSKNQLYKLFPDFKPEPTKVEKAVRKGVEVAAETVASGITKGAAEVAKATDMTAEQAPSISVGESLGKGFKAVEEPIGETLPGSDRQPLKTPEQKEQAKKVGVTGAPGAITGKIPTGERPKNIIIGIDVSQDFAGGPSEPIPATKRTVLETGDVGLFSIQNNPSFQGGTYLFLGDDQTESFSKPVEVLRLKAEIRSWSPEKIVAYKKGLGYSKLDKTITPKFVDDVLASAQQISETNYYNAVNGIREQISLTKFITGESKSGANVRTGTGTGVTVSPEELKAKTETVRLLGAELGVTLTEEDIKSLAYQYAKGAIDANTIKYQVARAGDINFEEGTAAATMAQLKALANSYGLTYSDAYLQTAAKNIITGVETLETVKQSYKDQAKMLYPTLADSLDKGYTTRQLSGSYLNYLASIRGVSEDNISMNDPFITKALTSLDDKGQPKQLPIWQFQQIVREEDPTYGFSKDAENKVTEVLNLFGKTFGKSW